MSGGNWRDLNPSKTFFVSLHLKLKITSSYYRRALVSSTLALGIEVVLSIRTGLVRVISQRTKLLGLNTNTQTKPKDSAREQIMKLRNFLSQAEWERGKNFIRQDTENSPTKIG